MGHQRPREELAWGVLTPLRALVKLRTKPFTWSISVHPHSDACGGTEAQGSQETASRFWCPWAAGCT